MERSSYTQACLEREFLTRLLKTLAIDVGIPTLIHSVPAQDRHSIMRRTLFPKRPLLLTLTFIALVGTALSGRSRSSGDPKEALRSLLQAKEAAKKQREASIEKLKARIAP